jgi:trans-aconitate 2-methyltransferase
MVAWDTAQYLKFGDERTRAARELLARVPLESAERVVDVGSGPGNSTALLVERFPRATITGVDDSPEMIQRAREDHPNIEWILSDLRSYIADREVDVLLANAVLQWVPDHAALLPELLRRVRPGGALAVQMPANFEEPSHRLMRETAKRLGESLDGARTRSPVEAPAFYYDLLAKDASVDVWTTRYEHVLGDATAIVEWVKGTGLRPYLEAISVERREPFLQCYTSAIDAAYPPRADGKRLFSFPRLFVVAVRR